MSKIKFYKYHGTGNDFLMIDNRTNQIFFDTPEVLSRLCDRRFGIGADGLILLENSKSSDFLMKYYNADGKEGSMCGNGGRCIAEFANFLGIINAETTFEAIDGIHIAVIKNSKEGIRLISLKMNDVSKIEKTNNAYILDTGSPHYVIFCNNTSEIDIVQEGKKIRYSPDYTNTGINVNFVAATGASFSIRTYERGVEDETYSCGTGTVAAALALDAAGRTQNNGLVKFISKGGLLEVSYVKTSDHYTDIWLTGPATQVFEGIIDL